MTKYILFLLTVCLTLSFSQGHAKQRHSLTFNIISHSLTNGAGKEVDVSIITGELEKLGHKFNLCDYEVLTTLPPSADINIFLAQLKPEWNKTATRNWFIPNPELCKEDLQDIKDMDLILCKTKETERIFTPLCDHVYYIGFTSIDHFHPNVEKNFHQYLHVAGKSRAKGTTNILNIWKHHPELPSLTAIRHNPFVQTTIRHRNYKIITKRLPLEQLLTLQNTSGIHLCPSRAEGFGHYIMEGMSTEAVILTTDAPPMNEFITDPRFLIKYSSTEKRQYAKAYVVDDKDFLEKLKALQEISAEELREIGKNNRQEYLRRGQAFKENFKILIDRTVKELKTGKP